MRVVIRLRLPARSKRRDERQTGNRLRWLERLLFAVGVVSLGYFSYVSAESALYQAYENYELDIILKSQQESHANAAPVPSFVQQPKSPAAIGRIEIPRLAVSAVVRTGSDARTLRRAVGHIPGTALPGEQGNAGLAGHRDTFFRRLRDIRVNDEIRFVGPHGKLRYRVTQTMIVSPRDVWVLEPTAHASVTLVTCYPFSYVGSAPQRFVTRAELITSTTQVHTNQPKARARAARRRST